jgi:hypothetical protein
MNKLVVLLTLTAVSCLTAVAANNCVFVTAGSTMTLQASCTTDATILVPDGFTLNGNGFTVTAVNPPTGTFAGAVIANGGGTANVTGLTVEALALRNICQPAAPVDKRLRGILFNGASGSITHSIVRNINRGPSGCQEGNAIEIRNAPFDGTHPDTKTVVVSHNEVTAYQKTGIAALGDVQALIEHNKVSSSATQANLAANSVQVSSGATGTVRHNQIDGNIWPGPSDYAATAILILSAGSGTVVRQNEIGGNADVAIYGYANGITIDNNKVFASGPRGPRYNIGIGDWGLGSSVTNNKVRGYETPYDGVSGGKNKVIPGPQKHDAFK